LQRRNDLSLCTPISPRVLCIATQRLRKGVNNRNSNASPLSYEAHNSGAA